MRGDGHIYVQFINGAPESKIKMISNDGKEGQKGHSKPALGKPTLPFGSQENPGLVVGASLSRHGTLQPKKFVLRRF
jgi:hypothetical protein